MDVQCHQIHAQIQYLIEDVGPAESFIDVNPANSEDVALLHNMLDEWIKNGRDQGFFWVGNVRDLVTEFTPDDDSF